YFLKTQRRKFGPKCIFNHPKDKLALSALENGDGSALPERPSKPPSGVENGDGGQMDALTGGTNGNFHFTPAMLHNSKGLPTRP
ncbi:hypothetical protein Ccrd_026113, partial [Cynara cardunculus var. scolymus]